MNILSLCDGMSCGHIALDKAGIKVDKYFAAEIKEIGIKVAKANYPETIHIGDVNKISYCNGVLKTEVGDFETNIDLVIFGSPCQTFSIAMKADKRTGLENLEKSGLFYQCNRILKEVNPKYFLMENVASMRNSDRDFITSMMGVNPIRINSSEYGPAMRDRYYWTNIKVGSHEPLNIGINDILENGYVPRDKARALLVSNSRPLTTPCKMVHRDFTFGAWTLVYKSREHYEQCVDEYYRLSNGGKINAKQLDGYEGHVFDGVRYLTQREMEMCQTVPEGYTKCLTRNEAADVLGDGWTIDVIAHIFKGLKGDN